MKTTLAFYCFLMLFLISFIYAGCSKDEEDTDKETEIISKEIRAGLKGDIVFTNQSNHVMKTTFHGSSFLLGNSTLLPPKWSPDGNLIAFVENDNKNISVKIFNKNGNEQNSWVLMTSVQSDGINPLTWSPDGTTIAILRGNKIIYLKVSTGEKTVTQIVQEGIPIRSIAWCPKNNKIAISQYLGVNSKSIFMVNAFENNPTKELLVNTEDFVEYMDWNADGSKLAYSGRGYYVSIFIINYDGTANQKIITKGVFEMLKVYGCAPCWVPNGKQIIYSGVTGVEGSTLIPGLFVTETEGAYNVNLEIEGTKPDCI